MHITFVKKILANGQPCEKCVDVEARLRETGHMARIDAVQIADERDPSSPGMVLAARHGITRAPFFVVEDQGTTRTYTVYLRFLREVLGTRTDSVDESAEILRSHPDLDFL